MIRTVGRALIPYLLAAVALVLAYVVGFSRGQDSSKLRQVKEVAAAVEHGVDAARGSRELHHGLTEDRVDKRKQEKERTDEALKANPDWADAAVPDSVWEALGGK